MSSVDATVPVLGGECANTFDSRHIKYVLSVDLLKKRQCRHLDEVYHSRLDVILLWAVPP